MIRELICPACELTVRHTRGMILPVLLRALTARERLAFVFHVVGPYVGFPNVFFYITALGRRHDGQIVLKPDLTNRHI